MRRVNIVKVTVLPKEHEVSKLALFKRVVAILGPSHYHMNFRFRLPFCLKFKTVGILIGIEGISSNHNPQTVPLSQSKSVTSDLETRNILPHS